tara:strand:+ start:1439 stop:1684 length:246 start_codon:yes stop_codon:yes gene_type:complete
MAESSKSNRIFDTINDMLESTKWQLMRPGAPKKIKMPEWDYGDIGNIMNHYRSAGWIVRASVAIETSKRSYTLEFVNPHHM